MRTEEPPQPLSHTTSDRSTLARPKLLVSVRGPDEVEAVINGGADWLDLKEPQAGALGAVSTDVARQVIDCVGGRLPISAALGELSEWDNAASQELLDLSAIQIVKLGLAGCARLDNWQAQWLAVAKVIVNSKHELAAVAYADWQQAAAPSPAEIISAAKLAKSNYFLLDTFDKKAGNLFTHLTVSELNDILCLAQKASLTTVVAGSLREADLAAIASTDANIVGVRGTVCGGNRNSKVDMQLVANFRTALNS